MNYERALKASKWNPAGVMKVLEGLEWECSECKGLGTIGIPDRTIKPPAHKIELVNCSSCVKGKIHYSHTPQVGEWYLWQGLVGLIDEARINHKKHLQNSTPILEWEEIERVLEKAGYKVDTARAIMKQYYCSIQSEEYKPLSAVYASTSQEAVMKAVLELGKVLK